MADHVHLDDRQLTYCDAEARRLAESIFTRAVVAQPAITPAAYAAAAQAAADVFLAAAVQRDGPDDHHRWLRLAAGIFAELVVTDREGRTTAQLATLAFDAADAFLCCDERWALSMPCFCVH